MDLNSAEVELERLIRRRRGVYAVCVDVDGTLAEYKGWRGYEHIGKPIKSVIDDLNALVASKKKVHVIIHTCRVTTVDNKVIPQALRALELWLTKNRIPYNEIWTGTGKPYANEYWDDKAVRKP